MRSPSQAGPAKGTAPLQTKGRTLLLAVSAAHSGTSVANMRRAVSH